MFAVAGDDESNILPTPFGAGRGNLDAELESATSGKSCFSVRTIAARWVPASTAITEFFDQFVAVDRTRKPVTLSSLGPPPDPCTCEHDTSGSNVGLQTRGQANGQIAFSSVRLTKHIT